MRIMSNMLFKGCFLALLGALVPVYCIIQSIRFNQECGGYLKQASDANNVELAIERIDKAIAYIELKGLTDGYTSVLWRTENDNIGFWYANIVACKKELTEAVGKSQLEQTNVLMKVRESLTDNGEKGTKLTIPSGISRYPDNVLFALLNTISFFLFLTGGAIVVRLMCD